MEEKERYEVISPSLNGYAYIHDFKTDNVLNTYDSCDLLNQQSKRIKELEEELDDAKRDYIPKLEFGLQRANKMGRDAEKENQQLKQQLADKEKYTYTGEEVGKIERKYDNKINALKQQLKCQPVEIVEKIIYHYDLNQIRDQFKNGFYGDARCVTIDGLGLIVYLEEMLKEYQK